MEITNKTNEGMIMAANPYTPPRAEVADVGTEEFQEIQLWSIHGRIGRLRYLAYISGSYVMLVFAVMALTAALGPTASLIMIVGYIAMLVFYVFTTIKRSHDMDMSGWMSLLTLIPFVGLIWVFKSGSRGENRFGAPPPPNTLGIKILGLIFPIIAIIGIAAAIALPAYQQYVQRAQESQQGN
jgi:uncharacterized membrane protein YhaH (DUF805 family)